MNGGCGSLLAVKNSLTWKKQVGQWRDALLALIY